MVLFPTNDYSKAAVWHSLLSSKGGTAKFSRFVVGILCQRGDNPPMKNRSSQNCFEYIMRTAILAEMVGDEADRRLWRMQGGGGSKNNEQTRGHLCRRSMRHCFFGEPSVRILKYPPKNRKAGNIMITGFWRRWWDSNPRAGSTPTKRFRVALVTTTSIHLHINYIIIVIFQNKINRNKYILM